MRNILGLSCLYLVAGCDKPMQKVDLFMADMAQPDLSQPDLVMGLNTGEACAKLGDCAAGLGPNQKPTCIMTTGQAADQIAWPAGYCSTPCRTARTDPMSGINSDCPGGTATCLNTGGAVGECRTLCATGSSANDCRIDYACFAVNNVALGCMPRAISKCDPKVAGSCPKDGSGNAQTCVNLGDGTVGQCVTSCDPFTNTGCDPQDVSADSCHASDQTGEGLCTSRGVGVPGGACGNFYSDCPGGYGCLMGKCWKYCNDANVAMQCSMGATCKPFSSTTPVKTAVAGLCTMSL